MKKEIKSYRVKDYHCPSCGQEVTIVKLKDKRWICEKCFNKGRNN